MRGQGWGWSSVSDSKLDRPRTRPGVLPEPWFLITHRTSLITSLLESARAPRVRSDRSPFEQHGSGHEQADEEAPDRHGATAGAHDLPRLPAQADLHMEGLRNTASRALDLQAPGPGHGLEQ